MATFEIPLIVGQPQSMSIALSGVTYGLRFVWADAGNYWFMDITDVNGNLLLAGAPLVPGADLLAQYKYLNVGGQIWVLTDGEPDMLPTFESLGDTTHLFYVDPLA